MVLRRVAGTVLLATTLASLSGCRILAGGAVLTVGAAGLVGYGVYKTGEAAVTAVGSVGAAVTGGVRSIGSVAFVNGEFKTTCDAKVDDVWLATARTLENNGFELLSGDRDALSGYVNALALNDQRISAKLEAAGKDRTTFRMKIGAEGDLKKSEALFALIEQELGRRR